MIKSAKRSRKISVTLIHIALFLLAIVWLAPIAWIVLTSFRGERGAFVSNIIPETFTFKNYILLFNDTSIFNFGRWYLNTFYVATATCIFSTFFTVATAYVMSRVKFIMRKPFMNTALILGMFPSFMSAIAVYYVLKTVNLTQTLTALIMVFSAGAGLKFYITKGFFDIIPKTLDEAAKIDGASNARVFFSIIIPMSQPIIVYTAITSFMAPWMDFIYARVIMGDNFENYTAAVGMYTMIRPNYIDEYFTRFAAGSVLISLPIIILFISLQRFYVEGVTGGAVKG